MSKWRVVKRDGAWQALDVGGDIRYAGREWLMAYTFALVAAPRKLGTVVSTEQVDD